MLILLIQRLFILIFARLILHKYRVCPMDSVYVLWCLLAIVIYPFIGKITLLITTGLTMAVLKSLKVEIKSSVIVTLESLLIAIISEHLAWILLKTIGLPQLFVPLFLLFNLSVAVFLALKNHIQKKSTATIMRSSIFEIFLLFGRLQI